MRVITGEAKGIHLKTLEGLDVRPTTDRVKEGMFSAIQFDLYGARVLDLFAGSGQLGIEAISRGARQTVFVDQSADALKTVRENLEKTRLSDRAVLHQMMAEQFIRKGDGEKFDFIFLDPPYRMQILDKILPYLPDFLCPGGKILAEHEKNYTIPEKISHLRLQKEYFYGKIVVSVLQYTEEAET